MKNESLTKIGKLALAVLWRAALIVAVLALVAAVGWHQLLDALFNGPSDSFREALTLSLLELDSDLPQKYLEPEVLAQLQAPIQAPVGTSDPGLVRPAPMSIMGTETVALECATAQVTLTPFPGSAPTISGNDGAHFWGVNGDNVLVLSSDRADLEQLGLTEISACSAILLLDGQPNTALLAHSGYGAYCALGQDAHGTWILVTTTGGTRQTPGATYRDLINIMTEYGAVNACVLSGHFELVDIEEGQP